MSVIVVFLRPLGLRLEVERPASRKASDREVVFVAKGKQDKASREVSGSGCEQTSEGKTPRVAPGWNKPG